MQIRRIFAGSLAAMLMSGFVLSISAQANNSTTDEPDWANPLTVAIKKAAPLPSSQDEPNFLNNLDCALITYHEPASDTGQTGCFSSTAIGWLDSDSGTTIFNGSDEGLSLQTYTSHQILVPWPGALDMVALDPLSTGGTLVSLYKNPLIKLQDERNLIGQLTAKRLTEPPELPIYDANGDQLVINPQTIAFSSNGSWLVAESLNGSFLRINLATLDETAFAQAYGSLGSPALPKSRVAISGSGRFIAIENDMAGAFKVYDLKNCSEKVCIAHDYWDFIHQQIPNLYRIRHVRFINEGLLSFEAISNDDTISGTYELAPRDKITSLIDYLGLGDSYTSGEGAFDYRAGTDTTDNHCHSSIHSYPSLLIQDLFGPSGGYSIACSGAVIRDIARTDGSYRGQVENGLSWEEIEQDHPALLASIKTNFLPGYIAQHRFVSQYQPGVATISIGGNDIGFGDMLVQCVVPHISVHQSDTVCFDTFEDRLEVVDLINRTKPRWTAIYKQLKAEAPEMRLYAIGYPDIVSDTGNCALNVHLSKSELEFAKELVIYLDGAIKDAASKAGVPYVDISQALSGHRLCETASYNVAVNGLTAGKDSGPFGLRIIGSESYHPNALGHRLIEQAILRATNNFKAPSSSSESLPNSSPLLSKPKSGRAVAKRSPARITAMVQSRKSHQTIKVSGAAHGLRARQPYSVHLDGITGPTLGNGISDDNGDIWQDLPLPENIPAGGHTIDVAGQGQDGEEIDVTQPIFVPNNDTDTDGDGIQNTVDSCPLAANSGGDTDLDGVDDSCDGFIGLPSQPSVGGQGNDSSTTTPASSSTDNSSSSASNSQGMDVTISLSSSGAAMSSPKLYTIPIQLRPKTKKVGQTTTASLLGVHTVAPEPNQKISQGFRGTIPHSQLLKIAVLRWLFLFIAWFIILALLNYCLKKWLQKRSSLDKNFMLLHRPTKKLPGLQRLSSAPTQHIKKAS